VVSPVRTSRPASSFAAAGPRSRSAAVRSVGAGRGQSSPAVYERRQPGGPSRSPPFPGPPARLARAVGVAAGRPRHWHSCVENRVSRRRPGPSSKIWGQLARLTEPCGSRCSALGDPSSSLWRIESFPRLSKGQPGRVGFSCSSGLFPAVPPPEQDMREVELPAPKGWCGTRGFRGCPQQRVSRACCPQIPVLGPAGRSFLVRFGLAGQTSGGLRWLGSGMALGEPSPWVWLRDGVDRLFHAVSVWELPPQDGDGPTAQCGRRVQVVSLLDEPGGGRCPACAAVTAAASGCGGERGRYGRG
jgi:hypothetical protein